MSGLKILSHNNIGPFVVGVFTAFLISCEHSTEATPPNTGSAQTETVISDGSVAPLASVKVNVDDLSTWSLNVIDKCSAEKCRDFITPYGIYKINDSTGSEAVRLEISQLIESGKSDWDIKRKVVKLKFDMLRAGCTSFSDSFCGNETDLSAYHSNKTLSDAFAACGDNLNFGETAFSKCVKAKLPKIPKFNPETGEPYLPPAPSLVYYTYCPWGDSSEARPYLNYSKFKGTLDEAVNATFDVKCLAWRK